MFMELWMSQKDIRDTSPINTTVERVGLLFLLQPRLSHRETFDAICCLSGAKVRIIIGPTKDYAENVIDIHHYMMLIINILTFKPVKYSVFHTPSGALWTSASDVRKRPPASAFGDFDGTAASAREAIRKASEK